jgi:hypothetical protein
MLNNDCEAVAIFVSPVIYIYLLNSPIARGYLDYCDNSPVFKTLTGM